MKQSSLGLFLVFSMPVCWASNPASTAYVDKQFAQIQTQIDQIKNNPAVAHPVGSCYGGGVVFYVNTTPNAPAGQRGLIAALADVSGGPFYWDTTFNTGTVIAPGTVYFTGAANTAAITAQANPKRFEAANAAYTYNGGGFNDWYLPAQDELMTMYTQAHYSGASFWTQCGGTPPDNSGSFPASYYWSSSQVGLGVAWNVVFGTGVVYDVQTSNQLEVRAVRAF